MIDLGERKWY